MLKKWTHIDGFDKESFGKLQDDLLHNLLWEDWEPIKSAPPTTSITPPLSDPVDEDEYDDSSFDLLMQGQDETLDETTGGQPPRKKAKAGSDIQAFDGLQDLFDSGDEADNLSLPDDLELDKIMDSAEEDEDGPDTPNTPSSLLAKYAYRSSASPEKVSTGSASVQGSRAVSPTGLGADEMGVRGEKTKLVKTSPPSDANGVLEEPRPKARIPQGKKRKGHEGSDEDPLGMGKKHNLKEIAERGQGGRIMFVFEKVSASKM